jgi:uncharacterized protein YjbJ (UPF0337 family)
MANDDTIKGKAENLKGRVKQAFGSLTGDKGKEAEGLGERVEGAAREKVGEVKRDAQTPPEDEDEDT